MKAQFHKILMIATLIGAAPSLANADLADAKTPLRIDFNKMINENSREQVQLRMQLDQHPELAEKTNRHQEIERAEVSDFIDVEVGFDSEVKPVVDRRFDSVGDPRVTSLKTMEESGS